jgi:hypothetical protein
VFWLQIVRPQDMSLGNFALGAKGSSMFFVGESCQSAKVLSRKTKLFAPIVTKKASLKHVRCSLHLLDIKLGHCRSQHCLTPSLV